MVVDGGEVDIVATDGGARVVAEVRTTTGGRPDPIDAVDPAKRRKVHRLARRIGADRVDFVGVGLQDDGVVIHWVPGA